MFSQIQLLLSEAVLYHDYRFRHVKDFSNYSNDGELKRNTTFIGNGIAFGSDGAVEVANDASLQNTEGTLVVFGDNLLDTNYGVLIAKRVTTTEWYFYTTSGKLGLYDGSYDSNLTIASDGNSYMAVSYKTMNRPVFYLDGVKQGEGSIINTISSTSDVVTIGSYRPTGVGANFATFKAALIFPRVLTETEHVLLFDYLNKTASCTSSSTIVKANIKAVKDVNLYGGYNCNPINGDLIDVSDQNNDASLTGQTSAFSLLGPAIGNDGSSSINTGITATQLNPRTESHTVSCWVRVDAQGTTYQGLIGKGDGNGAFSVYINGGLVRLLSDKTLRYYHYNGSAYVSVTGPILQFGSWAHIGYTIDHTNTLVTMYVDGVAVGTLADTTLHPSSAVDSDGFRIAGANSFSTVTFADLRGATVAPQFLKGVKDADWFKAEYEKGKTALFKTSYGVNESIGAVTSGALENTPFNVVSGGFKIVVDANKNKHIECTSSGVLSLSSGDMNQSYAEAAYGTWEFEGIGYFLHQFISSKEGMYTITGQNGYVLNMNSLGQIRLYRDANGVVTLLESDDTKLDLTVSHEYKITRSNSGLFKVYVDGSLVISTTDTIYSVSNFWNFASLPVGGTITYSSVNDTNNIVKKIIASPSLQEEEPERNNTQVEIRWKKMGSEFTYNVLYSKDEKGPWITANNTRLTDDTSSLAYNIYTLDAFRYDEKYFIKVISNDKYHQWWYSYNGNGSLEGGASSAATPVPSSGNTTGIQFNIVGE
jgi:hypothetical protein